MNDDLLDFDLLRDLLNHFVGATYPNKTLKRRLELLKPSEYRNVQRAFKRIDSAVLRIEIISKRAELEEDRWP